MENINNSYFQGFYKEIWRSTVPEQVTEKETQFFQDFFHLGSQSNVIDLMCGFGRHALALARRGINVTAIDNLKDYTDELQQTAAAEKLPITVDTGDLLKIEIEGYYDLAICMGNSLNFFPEHDILSILEKVGKRLKIGAHIVINTWSLTEIVAKGLIEKQWSTFEDLYLLSESNYMFQPTRIETYTTIFKDDTKAENKTAIDYIFSLSEMERMLQKSGFIYEQTFSIPGRKQFALGDPRAYIVARRV
ncbi:MAG: class I SAM-dependent methyltransferase [Chitinophagaceae bacterium]